VTGRWRAGQDAAPAVDRDGSRTIAVKGLAWWITGSVALLSDAMESFVTWHRPCSRRDGHDRAAPADADHPFGHTKAEYFSSGFEGLLIVGAAVGIIWAASRRFITPQPIELLGWGLTLTVCELTANWALAHRMMTGAREHRRSPSRPTRGTSSPMSGHRAAWSSASSVVHVTGWFVLDPLIAVAVALNILREGGRLAWRSIEGLMDTAVESMSAPRSTARWRASRTARSGSITSSRVRAGHVGSSTCTCTCPAAGRSAEPPRCVARSSRR
jgi:cation diffusion facilitator family transporter